MTSEDFRIGDCGCYWKSDTGKQVGWCYYHHTGKKPTKIHLLINGGFIDWIACRGKVTNTETSHDAIVHVTCRKCLKAYRIEKDGQ